MDMFLSITLQNLIVITLCYAKYFDSIPFEKIYKEESLRKF